MIVPNDCGAKCSFCFVNCGDRLTFDDWLAELESVISQLGSEFTQVSVSGGEPTRLKPRQLKKLLALLATRFGKIVVTTNGINLVEQLDILACYATHLNVSYHGCNKAESDAVFGDDVSLPKRELTEVCIRALEMGVAMRVQRVVARVTLAEVLDYAQFASDIGARLAVFRRDSNLEPTEEWMPSEFMDAFPLLSDSCPVCKSDVYAVGLNQAVMFKSGPKETRMATTHIYELIFHQDGTVSDLWESGKDSMPINSDPADETVAQRGYCGGGGGGGRGYC